MKKINISTPKYPNIFTLVDDEDFEYLNQWKWYPNKRNNKLNKFYAERTDWNKGNKINISMHRLIMNPPEDMCIDHVNGNALDNRKCNLRICNQRQNCQNSSMNYNNTSGYKGVFLSHNKSKPWRSFIICNSKQIQIGYFKTKKEAAKAYNCAARILFGEFANENKFLN